MTPYGFYYCPSCGDMEILYNCPILEAPEVMEILELDPANVFVIDTETTGLDSRTDDILELSIINGYGREVISKRYSSWLSEWPEAERVHGISPMDVEDLPTIESDANYITGLLRSARVIVGYNVFFDIGFLINAGVWFPYVPLSDVMAEFSIVYGEWCDWIGGSGGYKWQKLTTAGKYYKVDVEGAHASLRDCQITLEVLKRIAQEPEEIRHRT